MAYKQLVTPNPDISCQPGWCLKYVADTYGGTPQVYPDATTAWNAAQFKHTDQNFPGLAVPVWFSVKNVSEGHVALLMPDGSVYSTSDNSTTPHHHPSLQDLINYYANSNPLTYLGWSEDICGLKVVEGENMKLNKMGWQELAHGVLGRNGLSGRTNALDGSSDNSDYIGRELDNELIHELFISDEATKWRDSNDYASIPDINYRLDNPVIKEVPVEIPTEVTVEKVVIKYVPVDIDKLSIIDLLSAIWNKLLNKEK